MISMNTETTVAPAAETQTPAAEQTQPEVVTPGTEPKTEPQVSEKDERDRAIARMERRINQKHAQAAANGERARIAEDRLAQYERNRPAEERPKVEVDPQEVQRLIGTRAQEIARQSRIADKCNDIVNAGNKAFPDFGEAIAHLGADLPLFSDRGPTPALEAIMDADDPAALLHYLGKNPDIAADLADLSPNQLTRRLIKLEADMKPTRQTSSAPKPLEPVKPAAAPSTPDPVTNPAAWREWRNKTAKR